MNKRVKRVLITILSLVILAGGITTAVLLSRSNTPTNDDIKITYMVDGVIYSTTSAKVDGNISDLSTAPKKDGYTFLGWYSDDSYVEESEVTTDTVFQTDTMLYALYVPESIAGKCDIEQATGFTVENLVLSISVPNAKEHFSLSEAIKVSSYAKWTVTSDIGGINEIPSATVALAVGDNTYYINIVSASGSNKKQYTINIHRREIYSVTYVLNNGEQNIVENVEEDDKAENKTVKKTGYTFTEWRNGNEIWDFETAVKGDIVLEAVWRANSYTVSFDSNNGSAVADKEVTFDTAYNFAVPTRKGYTFSGWKTTEDTMLTDSSGVSKSNWDIASDTTVYAVWTANGYTITYCNIDGAYNSNPTKYTLEENDITLADATKTGYTFVGWYSDSNLTQQAQTIDTSIAANVTLWAKWDINEYTATFQADGTVVATVKFTIEDETLNNPTVPNKIGYNGKWESYTIAAKDLTINAIYSAIEYTITYENTKGATNNNLTKYTIESSDITLSDITAEGYTFDGWYDGATKVEKITKGSYGNKTFTAKWTAIEYKITYLYDKEIGDYADGNTNPATYTIEDEFGFIPLVNKTDGYTFNGWYTEKNIGTGTKVYGITKGMTGDITLYAQWGVGAYTITYRNTKTAINTNPTAYNADTETFTIKDLSLAGYTFDGWYNGETQVTEITKGTTGDIILTAKWTPIAYTITYENAKGATNNNATKYTIESADITLSDITAEGYTFDGWYNGETKVTEIAKGTTGNITLTAKWIAIEYTIRYENTKGATNNNVTKYTIESSDITLSDITAEGYTFDGWYEGATKVEKITKGSYGNKTLTAKWIAIEYKITYLYDKEIGDYADENTNPATYTIEDEFGLIPLVNKTAGYAFKGWYTEKNVGTGTKVYGIAKGMTGDITLYAQWGTDTYTITYHNTKTAINTNPTSYSVDTETFTIKGLSLAGYIFDGWYTDEGLTAIAAPEITKGSTGSLDFYAKWTPITYTIEYVTYGGSATGNPSEYNIESVITFKNATRSGYMFKGWYTAAEGGEKITGIAAGTTGNLILYAHWDRTSTIEFDTNGGSAVDPIINVEGTAISAPTAPTKEHYTFAGWYSDSALSKAYQFTVQPKDDITLYAKWTPVKYNIEYVLNGGTNDKNNVTTYTVEDKVELYAPSKVGYTFIGWFTNAEFTSAVVTELKVGTSGNITLYAHYSINRYTISFETNGGTSVSAITQNYATRVTAPEAPAKNGYTFAGWYSNASLTSKYTFSTMPAENITLYAKWNLATYSITYNLNGGTNNSSNPATYTINSAKIILKAPTKTGYSFAGWYTDAECTSAIFEIASGSYGDIELFAKWTMTEYTITYVTADGATHSNITSYTIETNSTVLTKATLKGHTFDGWFAEDSFATKVTAVAGGEIGNKTLYAKFTANTYTVWLDGNEEASCVVSFNLNGAEGTIAAQTVTPTVTLKYPTVPTRDGYIFAGWYNNENCTGSPYDFTAVVTKDTTLYAKWVKIENAGAIEINGSSTITLNGKTEQMLMFVPLVSGNITITSSGSYDTFGTLYNSERVALMQDDDTGVDGQNFLIVYNVTAGETYYIGARAFSSTTTGTATVSISGETKVPDGGYTVTVTKGSATYGQSFAFNVPGARSGYKFLGYEDENGVMYTDGTGASVKVWDKDKDTTLYSVWERTVYTVTFETSGGSVIEPIQLAYGARLDIGRFVTTRAGYTFNGWYLDGEEYNATTMPDHNITLTAYWKTFALGTIKYDTDKKAVSVNDKITAELFDAICLDTNGKLATFTVTISGTQEAGNTISVRLVATSDNKTKQVTITGVKVYAMPTLIVTNTAKDYINPNEFTASAWGASGTDTFGDPTTIKVYIDGEYKPGDIVTVTIDSVDPAGNTTRQQIENVKVYAEPVITFNQEKTAISVNDTISAELFSATAQDSFGEALTVTANKYGGTIAAGNTVVIRLTATDSKGNVKIIDISCKVYGLPTISYATKTDFTVSDEITPTALGITAKDTYNVELEIKLTCEGGTVSMPGVGMPGGETRTYIATATDIAGNTKRREYTVRIYGTPTITVGRTDIKVTEDPVNNISVLEAVAIDSFGYGLPLSIELKQGELKAGMKVIYTLTATDKLGNVGTKDVTVSVYDQNDILLTYTPGKSDIIKLSSKGEEFDARATDSFDNNCDISIEAAESYILKGGEIIDIYVVATDKAGNKKYSELIKAIKVYDMPTVVLNQENYTITADTDIDFLFTVYDSFGEELVANITLQGELIVGNVVDILVQATDDAGNIVSKTYGFGVLPSELNFVELYVDWELWQTLFVNDGERYILPIPENREGYNRTWVDANGQRYTEIIGVTSTVTKLYLITYKQGYTPITTSGELKSIALNGKYQLLCDLDLGGIEWTPIGTKDNPFVGVFDGNGYTISNFKATKSVEYAGLFGYNSGTIENLGLENFTINVSCSSSGSGSAYSYAGGIVGHNSGSITNCYTTGAVSASSTCDSGYPYSYAGGIAGRNSEGSITNCYATGDVSATSSGYYSYAGGIAGYNYMGSLTNCYATGYISSSSSSGYSHSYSYAGGIVGYNSGDSDITNCNATGDVSATSSSDTNNYSYAGGIAGYNYGSITNCYATGDVSVTSSTSGFGSIYSYAGGIAGYNYMGSITNCYATGDVSSSSSGSYSYSHAGGIAGYNDHGSITNCYATGDVKSKSSAGGIVGGNDYGSITNCYATGDVESKSYAGGIAGNNYCGSITNCYATGNARATGYYDGYAGGIVGHNVDDDHGSITNCYRYSGQKFAAKKNNMYGTKKSLDELKSLSFHTSTLGWSADDWLFTDGTHPTLKNVGTI